MSSDTTRPTSATVDAVISVAAHLDAELAEALGAHRLSRPSYLVLDALDGADGPVTQRELVARVRRTAGTMSVRLGRLERAGMIEREPDPENRRSALVTLTDRGRELVRAARPAYEERAERLLGALPEGARASLAEHAQAWLAFFEPAERTAPRLGAAVAPPSVATRMRRAVGLPDEDGVLVLKVGRASPAAQAGLSRGDLVTAAAGAPVRSIGDLDRAVRGAGGTLALRVLRGAEARDVEVTLPA
jgi:DNA-binding MarR family transcriptional regulator